MLALKKKQEGVVKAGIGMEWRAIRMLMAFMERRVCEPCRESDRDACSLFRNV